MASPDDLRAMDLKKKGANDECLAYGQWTRIHAVHTLAKVTTYQTDFPVDDGDWWRHVKPNPSTPGTINTPKCNLPVAVARLSTIIPAGGQYNSDRNVVENGFVITKMMAVWSKKQMMCAKATESNFKHLDVTAPMNAYAVTNYVGYIPIQATDTDEFKDQYLAHHVGTSPGLEKQHISVSLSVF